MSTFERIEAAAMKLSVADRWRLVERLVSSLGGDDEVALAWAEEVERRIDALERGDTSVKPVGEMVAAARARIVGGVA